MSTHILVVEDNKDLAELLKLSLHFYGYEASIAGDGTEAVKSAIANHPDLILMDMMMPKVDGFETTVELRQHPKTKAIPILAATALASSRDEEKCLATGCDGYIAKPFTPRELAEAIGKLLPTKHRTPKKRATSATKFS